MGIKEVLALLSGVALFLYGMTLMSDGLKKVAGNALEVVLYKLSSNPIKGILLGTGITAAIQSSSATSVMAVGFVNSKMMKIGQAISVIMGAVIGTSVTGWVVSLSSIEGSSGLLSFLSTSTLTAIIAIIGIYLRMFCKHTKQKQVGDILMGFAVLMFGMAEMSGSVSGLRNSEVFINLLTNFSNPIIGIIVGAGFTAIIQSASAAVGILQALSTTGAISMNNGIPMLLGIGIGAALPVLLSALGASRDGKRAACSYLIVNTIGAIVISIIFYVAKMISGGAFAAASLNTFDIALVNTCYRALYVVLLIPFISLIEKITGVIIKQDDDEEEVYEEDLLEERFIQTPALALEQCRLTINSMAELTRDNIVRACSLLFDWSDKNFTKVNNKENTIDKYADKLGTYLVKITRKELTKTQNKEASKYLHAIGDFERIGDHALNIAQSAQKLKEDGKEFTDEGRQELKNLTLAIMDMCALTVQAFQYDDLKIAFQIEPFEQMIDDICEKMKSNHIERLKKDQCSMVLGITFNDLITDLERVGDHCSNVAVSMIELKENYSLNTHDFETKLTDEQKENYNNLLASYKSKYGI